MNIEHKRKKNNLKQANTQVQRWQRVKQNAFVIRCIVHVHFKPHSHFWETHAVVLEEMELRAAEE